MGCDSPAQRVVNAEEYMSSSDGTARLHIDWCEERMRKRATNRAGQSIS
jgi:hypothetical protein